MPIKKARPKKPNFKKIDKEIEEMFKKYRQWEPLHGIQKWEPMHGSRTKPKFEKIDYETVAQLEKLQEKRQQRKEK
jgi:hypothetical protein